jgi:hypothetical protein
MRTTDVFNARFGQAEEAHFAFTYEIADGPGDILHRHGWVHPRAFSATLSGNIALHFKGNSKQPSWRRLGRKQRPRENVLQPLPTCFVRVD